MAVELGEYLLHVPADSLVASILTGPRAGLHVTENVQISFHTIGIKHQLAGWVAHGLVTVPTELSRTVANCILFQVCLGFVQNFDDQGRAQVVTPEYVTTGQYEVDIAGIRYPAKVNLHSPNLPTKYPDKERLAYRATRDIVNDVVISTRSK